MPKTTREAAIRLRAIEALAQHLWAADYSDSLPLEYAYDDMIDAYGGRAEPLVDAVLAVASPAYRAEALRDAADDWPEWAKLTDENDRQSLHGHRQVFQSWLRDRADAEEGA